MWYCFLRPMMNWTPYEQLLNLLQSAWLGKLQENIRNKVNTDTKSAREFYYENKFEVLNVWKSYAWTTEWRIIKWRMIITVTHTTFAVAKRKPEKKKFRLVRDSHPWPLQDRCSALPIKLTSQNKSKLRYYPIPNGNIASVYYLLLFSFSFLFYFYF